MRSLSPYCFIVLLATCTHPEKATPDTATLAVTGSWEHWVYRNTDEGMVIAVTHIDFFDDGTLVWDTHVLHAPALPFATTDEELRRRLVMTRGIRRSLIGKWQVTAGNSNRDSLLLHTPVIKVALDGRKATMVVGDIASLLVDHGVFDEHATAMRELAHRIEDITMMRGERRFLYHFAHPDTLYLHNTDDEKGNFILVRLQEPTTVAKTIDELFPYLSW